MSAGTFPNFLGVDECGSGRSAVAAGGRHAAAERGLMMTDSAMLRGALARMLTRDLALGTGRIDGKVATAALKRGVPAGQGLVRRGDAVWAVC